MPTEPIAGPPVPSTDRVAELVEREFGGTVTAIHRQLRWRPTWFVDLSSEGRTEGLVVRGDRLDTQTYPLRHEMAFHSILEEHGIPVPALRGYLDEIDAIVMAKVPGKPDFAGVPDAERDVVVDEYLQALVRVHQLPVEPFVIAGILHAEDPAESAMVHRTRIIGMWRAAKKQPDPFMEFALGWLLRHPPRSQGRQAPILSDTGQFHHDGGHLVAILDLEFGHIGDPMLDIAQWRMRDTLIPFGDFDKLYARYEELSGTPIDWEAIKRHRFASTLGNQLLWGPAVLDPVPGADLMNNMQWNSETNLHATEALAEYLDVELPTVETPEPRRTRQDPTFEHLVGSLRRVSTDDEQLRHELRLAFRAARHLQRTNQIGDAIVAADLDDLVPLLGYRPETWQEGDAALEQFVLADAHTGRHDVALLQLFHKRNLRVHMQMGPEGSSMVAHYPTQPFTR